MRRRRRKGNPLLLKIVGIVIVLHLIALPILARLGVFQKVEREYADAQVIVLPPPEKLKQETKRVEHKAAPKTARHSRTNVANRSRTASNAHANPNQPKVIADAGGPAGDGGGPGVDQGTGVAGQLPTVAATPKPAPTPAPTPAPAATPAPAPTPEPARPTPRPPTPSPPAPVQYDEPVVAYAPKPTLPDSFLANLTGALDATAVVEVPVNTDGKPGDGHLIQSSGTAELDQIALDIARQYRFKPATRDGQPVDAQARVHIEFVVN